MTDPAASTSAAAATPALGPSAPAIAAHGRRRSLAWRLGLLLGVSVVVVLLLVGVVVNRVVSSGFQTVLTEQQQQRLDDAAVTLADRLARPTGLVRAQAVVTRLATSLGGQVEVVSTAGTTLAAYGRQPDRRPGALRGPDRGRRPGRRDAPGRRAGPCRRSRVPAAVQRDAGPGGLDQRGRDRGRSRRRSRAA